MFLYSGLSLDLSFQDDNVDSTRRYRQLEFKGSRTTPLTRTLRFSRGWSIGTGTILVGTDLRRDSLDVDAT
jgi:hypothetical protein